MCGIVGYIDRSGSAGPIGPTMLGMLNALGRRGPDSAGIAAFNTRGSGLLLRVKLSDHEAPAGRAEAVIAQAAACADVIESSVTGSYLRIEASFNGDPMEMERTLEAVHPEIEVVSMGHSLEIVKQVGSPANLDSTYGVQGFAGTHAIGHTRLSTESKVDLSHSQPFWAHGTLDIAVAHNGHITNYHKLRRQYEMRGIRFYTENDSEIIGIYLKMCMSQGMSFDEALKASMQDFDGSFCYLAASGDQLGFAKDPFGLKPLTVLETEAYVAIATEEQALCAVFGQDVQALEPQPGAIRTWRLTGPSEKLEAA